MLHGDTIATLRSWEADFPVLEWRVDGIHVWPLLRNRLASRLLEAGRPALPARPPGSRQRDFVAALSRGARVWARERRPDRASIETATAVILTRPANRQLVNGAWYDRLFDPIADVIEAQGGHSLHLEYRTTAASYRTPRHRPAIPIRSAVNRRNVMAAGRWRAMPRLRGFDDFATALRRSHPGIRMPSPRWITHYIRAVDLIAAYFERIVRRSSARVALTSVYYTQVGMAFCLAARRLGITAVDVQHGVTAGNPAYDGWTAFPADGFALLPDVFWCWSDADARAVRRWPPDATAHRAVVGGHPWFAVWDANRPALDALGRQMPSRGDASKAILVTLSWSSGLSDRIKDVIAQSPASWVWWMRLHPLMQRERADVRAWAAAVDPARIIVDEATDLPLPLLLEHADVHLTHNSTVVQEASRCSTPSVVIDNRALDVYMDELSAGWAVYAGNTFDIIAALTRQSERRLSLVPLSPYPSWNEMSRVVLDSAGGTCACLDTAAAASSPKAVRA